MTVAAGKERDQHRQGGQPQGGGGGGATGTGRDRRRGRAAVVAVMLASLVGAGFARYGAMEYRARTAPPGMQADQAEGSGSRLSEMPSFATALLLGGLRGPLVMILWTSSESQKAEKNLQDFDTKVEWIRLLQPEFDSVHIFQIWNKAYNISVQMASLSNKYATILDALDYAHRIEKQRPNNINIEVAIADVYFNKLGMSTEKEYYGRRVREDTRWRPLVGPRPGEVGWRRTRMDPMLDQKGDILPAYRESLEYLKKYEPFPYGIPPFGLAYNYYRRAQILQSVGGQTHLQLSDQVLDSRPALTLKNWCENELEMGRRLELEMFGKAVPTERQEMEMPTASVGLDQKPVKPELATEAAWDYHRAEELAGDAIAAYERHLRDYGESVNFSTFASHLDHMKVMQGLAGGDYNYLKAMAAQGAERQRYVAAAREAYQDAITAAERTELKYYVDDGTLNMLHVRKTDVPGMSAAQLHQAVAAVRAAYAHGMAQVSAEDRMEYEGYIQRAGARLAQLAKG